MLPNTVTEPSSNFAVEMKGVVHTYNKKRPDDGFIFADWQLREAEQVFLYGNSGSGKSTLLNLLSGILQPQVGSINLFGTDIAALSNRARDQFRANNIGVVFQQFNLIPYLNIEQNIKLAAYFGNASTKEKGGVQTKERVETLMDSLQLSTTLMHRKVSELSVGQRQRVAILRAFANSPTLLLVDEPTSALDASARDAFMKLLLTVNESQGSTMIFVSHDEVLKSYFKKKVAMSALLSANTPDRQSESEQMEK